MRYLKIAGTETVCAKDSLTQQDLLDVRENRADALIDLADMTFFDTRENRWKPIPMQREIQERLT